MEQKCSCSVIKSTLRSWTGEQKLLAHSHTHHDQQSLPYNPLFYYMRAAILKKQLVVSNLLSSLSIWLRLVLQLSCCFSVDTNLLILVHSYFNHLLCLASHCKPQVHSTVVTCQAPQGLALRWPAVQYQPPSTSKTARYSIG